MDTDDDGRWMTYEELADARGIDHQSARRLASRLKWRRQKDNHGTVRVYVPSRAIRKRDMSADMPAVLSADMSIVIKPLEAAIAVLQEQLVVANARGDRLEAEVREQRSRADRAEGLIEGMKVAAAASPSSPSAQVFGLRVWLRSVRDAFKP